MTGKGRIAVAAVAIATLAVYWRTAYPTITWWDSSSYSLQAATFGVTSPPGSLFLVLLGWPLTKLPLGLTPAHTLNLFAGVLATITIVLVLVVSQRAMRTAGITVTHGGATLAGVAAGALTLAFGPTLWEHATKFTPYGLTAVFTALILWAMLKWWETAERSDAWKWLFVIGLLFGLDFSVHRTNALLVPGALAWVLIRSPRVYVNVRASGAAVAGLVLGLAVHLVTIPIARGTNAPLNMYEPTTLAAFWDYVSLANSGGNFLINLLPRKSDFWSVQVADFVRVVGDNFWRLPRGTGALAAFALVGAVAGFVALVQKHRRLGVALATVAVLHAAFTVIYFNIPADYFRSLDRHYLPVLVTFTVFVACGFGVLADRVVALLAARTRGGAAAFVAGGAILLVPAAQLMRNFAAHDASHRFFARDYAVNALTALPPDAMYFTVGDNDTFPVLYMQAVEGVRPDVQIINASLANTDWYIDRIRAQNPSFPVRMNAADRVQFRRDWRADSLRIDSVTVSPRPQYGPEMLPSDAVLFDIVRTNRWRRPLAFAITGGETATGWLAPYARLEGLYWRIMPASGVRTDADVLRGNLFGRYEYRGYNDERVQIEDVSQHMALQYYTAAGVLMDAAVARGDAAACRRAYAQLTTRIPPARLTLLPPGFAAELRTKCGG